jgi:vacuolar iron transporter family protein
MNLKLDGKTISDITLGMSDGLTVPFALAAGLAGAISQSHVVLIGGLAELSAGGISMGLEGYLAAKSQADTYKAELQQEHQEMKCPDEEVEEVRQILENYGLQGEALTGAVKGTISNRSGWAQFMMKEELGLEQPESKQALKTALFIGGAYVVGRIVPLAPYGIVPSVSTALYVSIGVTSLALLIFGALKGKFTSILPLEGSLETFMVGSLAAAAAFVLARLLARP